ncbi:MAG: PDZ domain-containing protein, partial [Planctomycetota bacterium]|nr:PDZ domain-containing protein [Planctomycetota bacterium]
AALGAYLVWFVHGFLQEKEGLSRGISQEEQKRLLESIPQPEPPRDDVVSYDKVQRTFHKMNWTGKVAPKPIELEPTGPEVPVAKPVSELLRVQLVQVDTDAPAGSMALVAYDDPVLSAAVAAADDYVLMVGETLAKPYDYVKVSSIQPDGVHFVFTDDAERAEEVVSPPPFPNRAQIVKVGPDGARLPAEPRRIVTGPRRTFRPKESYQKGVDIWVIGTEDAAYMGENYSKILSEVYWKKHRNPKTGEVDGIEITGVKAGSMAAKYGAKSGQVIKSINGHPVKSVNEAVSFAKQNQDKYDTWVIVYEEQGKEYTKVFETPDE